MKKKTSKKIEILRSSPPLQLRGARVDSCQVMSNSYLNKHVRARWVCFGLMSARLMLFMNGLRTMIPNLTLRTRSILLKVSRVSI